MIVRVLLLLLVPFVRARAGWTMRHAPYAMRAGMRLRVVSNTYTIQARA
jgi:hypothetical protein